MQKLKIGFIGFGLIGGSIARALKAFGGNYLCYCYSHDEKAALSYEKALSDGVLHDVDTSLEEHFPDCDVIFLCAPVLDNTAYLEKLKPLIKPSCLITDVGSVKGNICKRAEELGLAKNFIGGHPMTGSEKTGYENSSSYLFENVYYILTPTADTPASLIDRMSGIIAGLRAIPVFLPAKRHDDIVAAISHVPHIIASALVHLVKDEDDDNGRMMSLAAGGFKDITRIASASPAIWQNICLTNPAGILKFLSLFKASLDQISDFIASENEEALYRFFDSSKNYRDLIPDAQGGLLKSAYSIFVDLIDETGAIASLSTLLASNGISIKNIGIVHNREYEEGVLRMELYDAPSRDKAVLILKKHHYMVYER